MTEVDPELLREAVEEHMDHPAATDGTPFVKWLRGQVNRKDAVGSLARVAMKDPTWPRGADRARLSAYFQQMGARKFVQETLRRAWHEFEREAKRERTREKNKAAKAARAVTRRDGKKKNRKRKRR